MTATNLSDDLAWWRANRDAPVPDPAALSALLTRLQAWKVQHDQDRANHPPPFMRMFWDAVFADDDGRVTDAIGELEAALRSAKDRL